MTHSSNRAVVFLLIAAIVVSLTGTVAVLWRTGGAGITGFASQNVTAETNFSINSSLSIAFVNALVPFGAGTVNASWLNCSMGTNGSSGPLQSTGCIGFNATVNATNLTLQNTGNILLNVSLNFTQNASKFIGGGALSLPLFKYLVYNYTASCSGGIPVPLQAMHEVNITSDTTLAGTHVCTALNTTNGFNTIGIAIWISVPADAPTTVHRGNITATGCDDNSC